jgi:alkaline phosphatase D
MSKIGVVVFLVAAAAAAVQAADGVAMANGAKAGEITSSSAIIWTRLTRHPERNTDGVPFPKVQAPAVVIPPGKTSYEANAIRVSAPVSEALQLAGHALDEMEGAVPGAPGTVRIAYWPEKKDPATALRTDAKAVTADADFACQFELKSLEPGTRYRFRAEGFAPGQSKVSGIFDGAFKTAPLADDPARVRFTMANCQDYARRDDPENGHQIYAAMARLAPDFFVHAGDIEYYDKPTPLATSERLARFKWNRIFALPYQRAFHGQVGNYFMKDDHDTLKDDAWAGQRYGDLTWEQGLALFREQVPMGGKTYRTRRWGKDLQIWLVEGRDFRSPNDQPDGPEKSIWGAEQKRWFFETVKASDATFRILISPTPLAGPDRDAKGDNHANRAFAHEGQEIRDFVVSQKNMIVLCGDRHWQYVSVDPTSGLREYCCGPSSDAHASGFSEAERTAAHRYLKIAGGFLSVEIERFDGRPRAVLRHHAVNGEINYEDILSAD